MLIGRHGGASRLLLELFLRSQLAEGPGVVYVVLFIHPLYKRGHGKGGD